MNKIIHSLGYFLVGFVLVCSDVSAADIKVGYVDAARLLEQAPQATRAFNKLKAEFSSREADMNEAQQSLKDAEEKILKDGDFMVDTERKKIEIDILAKKRDMRRQQEELREDFNLRRNEEIGKLQQYIRQAIEIVGKEGAFDLIFYEGRAYASSRTDITALVLERLEAPMKDVPDKSKE